MDNQPISPFIPEARTLGGIKLGASIQGLEKLGQPLAFHKHSKQHYALEYPNLHISSENEILTYIGCTFGEIEITTLEKKALNKGTSVKEVMLLLGTPNQHDLDDVDDIVLTYHRGSTVVECEFGEEQELIRVNCYLE